MRGDEVGDGFLGDLTFARRLLGRPFVGFDDGLVPGFAHDIHALEQGLVVLAEHSFEAQMDPDFVQHHATHLARAQILQNDIDLARAGMIERDHAVAFADQRYNVGEFSNVGDFGLGLEQYQEVAHQLLGSGAEGAGDF